MTNLTEVHPYIHGLTKNKKLKKKKKIQTPHVRIKVNKFPDYHLLILHICVSVCLKKTLQEVIFRRSREEGAHGQAADGVQYSIIVF